MYKICMLENTDLINEMKSDKVNDDNYKTE